MMNFITNIFNSAATRGLLGASGFRGSMALIDSDRINRDMESFSKSIQEFTQSESIGSILKGAFNQSSNSRVKTNLKQASDVSGITFS